jgi:hypothetical protein
MIDQVAISNLKKLCASSKKDGDFGYITLGQ